MGKKQDRMNRRNQTRARKANRVTRKRKQTERISITGQAAQDVWGSMIEGNESAFQAFFDHQLKRVVFWKDIRREYSLTSEPGEVSTVTLGVKFSPAPVLSVMGNANGKFLRMMEDMPDGSIFEQIEYWKKILYSEGFNNEAMSNILTS
jgi:hypothetical protein